MELNDTHLRYLLAVHQLTAVHAAASSKDIADYLSVSKASDTNMMSILVDKGLVDKARYGKIRLTDAGSALAENLAARMSLLAQTLQSQMTLTDDEARKAACAAICELPVRCLFLGDACPGQTAEKPAS